MTRELVGTAVALAIAGCGSIVVLDGDPNGNGSAAPTGGGGTATSAPPAEPPDLGPCPVPATTNPDDQDAITLLPGNDPGCPTTPGKGSCELEDTLCTYDVPCQSGIMPISVDCEFGHATVNPETWESHPCTQPYDYCPSLDELCRPISDDEHVLSPATGSDDPYACPWDRPAEGSGCTTNYYGGPRCGYWCDDTHRTWTVTECIGPGSVQKGYWKYDDACRPDCER